MFSYFKYLSVISAAGICLTLGTTAALHAASAAEPAAGALTLEPVPALPRLDARRVAREWSARAAGLTDAQAARAAADLLAVGVGVAAAPRVIPIPLDPAAPAPARALPAEPAPEPDAAPASPAADPAAVLPADRSAAAFARGWTTTLAADPLTTAPARSDLTPAAAVPPATTGNASLLAANGSGADAGPGFAEGVPLAVQTAVAPQPAVAAQPLVRAWGYNNYGQLGNGTTNNASSPVTVSAANGFTGLGVTAVAAGGFHSLALQGGAVYAWGYNGLGALGNNSTTDSLVPVAVSSANGFVNTSITAVAAGGFHSLALQGGAVYAWGDNEYGQLGNNSTTSSSVPFPVSNSTSFINSNVTAVAAGDDHSLALQGGAVYAWGYNNQGQLGNNSTANSLVPVAVSSANGFTNTGVTAIAGGYEHSLAIRNGAVYAWGYNNYGQLGNGTTTNSSVPVAVLNLSTGVTAVAAGQAHSLAVQNGNVFAWGDNGFGELGNNSTTNSSTPVELSFGGSFLSGIVQVAATEYSSYALASDGSLYVWGRNDDGELGLGTTTSQYNTPQHLLPPTGQYYEVIDGDAAGFDAVALLGSTLPVPEPATWAGGALLVGVAGLTLRRRLRRA